MNLFAVAAFAVAMLAPALSPGERDRWAGHIAAGAADRAEVYARAVTVAIESSFRRKVERCEVLGAGGEVTAWQLHGAALGGYSAAQVCRSPALAARLGSAKLRAARARARAASWEGAIVGYVGRLRATDRRVVQRLAFFRSMLRDGP